MSRRTVLRWGAACVLGMAIAWGLSVYFGPHPVYGPAKPVDLAAYRKLLSGPAKPPVTARFPQLAPRVVTAVSPAAETGGEAAAVPASISGKVVDKDTGAGVPGASLRLVFAKGNRAALSATADAEGRYQIPSISTFGDAALFASAEGYCSTLADFDAVVPGTSLSDVDIQLERGVGRIAGRVLDQSRAPVPEAVVEVMSGEGGAGQVALSDAQGAFSIALPADGEVTLRAGKEGYGQERFEGITAGMEQLELILLEQAAIAGRVTDRKGKPRQGLNVVVLMEKEGSVWDTSARTDENGAYRVDGLSASYSYTVRVTLVPRGDLPPATEKLAGLAAYVRSEKQQERKMEEMKQTLMPDSGLAQQTGVQVKPGQVTTVDLQVNEGETNTALVYGRITDPDTGEPVCPMQLQGFWHESMGASFLGYTTTDVDGSYELYLPAVVKREKVWILTGWDGSKPAACVEVDPEVPTELNLSISAPIVVPVRCVDEKGAPMAGLVLTMRSETITDAEGRGTVYGLSPYVTHTITAYEKVREPYSVTLRVGVSGPFSGKPGETVPEVLIRCAERFGSVTGQLVIPSEAVPFMYDEEPRLVFGFLFPEGGEVCPITGTCDADNKFRFDQVSEGKYRLELFLPVKRVEARRKWWAMFDDVEIVAGQNVELGLVQLNVSEDPL